MSAPHGSQDEAKEVSSPCNGVCRIDPCHGWCAGCLRTLDEITAWSGLADERKRALWQQLRARRAALPRPEPDSR